ncbi:hypothetical protein LAZ40_09880 [Cereibacter sphaeroides]|uniref:hypothetical protein n=1 Tax=Cereibacter sphaeroides TaxID=1063 RepID=UPI001F1D2D11|nr:hypothetical protein [Cereibacter sphaeroides]MCE6959360.1 hypothetical protein [Cereibacter sphaeroides]MCE6972952.1 hypothetical protein [Cereibacter sphaeroides]
MDRYVAPLLLNEGALVGIALLLIIAGGVVAAKVLTVEISFRRVTYLWFIALLTLGLSIAQFAWALTPAAANAGLLAVLMFVMMGLCALYGAGTYYASAARSRHIGGDTSRAWMGFVPIVNLWLFFKGGDPAAASGTGDRSGFARFVLDPLLVLGALFVITLSRGIDKVMEDTPLYNQTDSAALRQLLTESRTLEESFADEARLTRAQLPVRIDEITLLSGIEARQGTLRMTYDVEQDIPGLRTDFEATLAKAQCAPEVFGTDLARGGVIEMVYRAPSGRIIATYVISQADCTS